MDYRKNTQKKAFTIIEVMLAIAILLVAVLGTSAFRYSAALNARRADLQTTASRTALLLCESWSGVGGSATFNPEAVFVADINIISHTGPTEPLGFNVLGSYQIVMEGNHYYATLSWIDIAPELRALNVIVNWDQADTGTHDVSQADRSYQLTTYIENPN